MGASASAGTKKVYEDKADGFLKTLVAWLRTNMLTSFEVVYQGIRLTVEEIVATAQQEDVDAIGLSILSGSHMALVPAMLDQLSKAGMGDVPVIVGGIIPVLVGLAMMFLLPESAEFNRARAAGTRADAGNLLKIFGEGRAAPALIASRNAAVAVSPFELLGALIWLVAVVGEAVADRQLREFKANPANTGTVCRVGLWGWSRHPNYFFEWLIWVSFATFALGSPWGWLGIFCPMLMLYFLLRVTGIPATEAHAVRSRGEAYRQYQREVSAFVPRPPTAS